MFSIFDDDFQRVFAPRRPRPEKTQEELIDDAVDEIIDSADSGDMESYEAFEQYAYGTSKEYCQAMQRLSFLALKGGTSQLEINSIGENVIYPLMRKYAREKLL